MPLTHHFQNYDGVVSYVTPASMSRRILEDLSAEECLEFDHLYAFLERTNGMHPYELLLTTEYDKPLNTEVLAALCMGKFEQFPPLTDGLRGALFGGGAAGTQRAHVLLVCDVMKGWRRGVHRACGETVRRAVKVLLLLQFRLTRVSQQLPAMPPEMVFCIASFFPYAW